jgi:NADH-quinone oxidoreductase subunit J
MVVISKNPIYSVLYLILAMFGLSGHYILLHAQFIAVVNIIVYAGAIMVLFLFVLMLLNMNKSNEPNKSIRWKLIGVFLGILTFVSLVMSYVSSKQAEMQIWPTKNSVAGIELPTDFGYVKPLGNLLFSKYVLPFELASILFIAAMVGVVFLGQKEKINP